MFTRIEADDAAAVGHLCRIRNAAAAVDDPDEFPCLPEIERGWVEFGSDLHPEHQYLYTLDGETEPIGWVTLEIPVHDNLHLIWIGGAIVPEHRHRRHGTALLDFALGQAREHGRTTVWAGARDGGDGVDFLLQAGFRKASSDARRRQRLADVDPAELDRLEEQARAASMAYVTQRLVPPTTDTVLAELVEVTAAINDAPMGSLTYEDEVFDVERLREVEAAAAGRGARRYRVVARDRDTGEAAGHTQVSVHPLRPAIGHIGDTAVAKTHRGHRLGLRLKIDMLRWLAEAEPQLEIIETWNNVDNPFMISVNESIGYRLAGTFSMYELTLDPA